MIDPEKLQSIANRISGQALNESVIASLRGEYPDIHFT